MRIYIESKPQCIQDVSGSRFLVHPLKIANDGEYTYLQDRLDCSDVEEAKFVKLYKLWGVPFSRKIALPERVRAAVVQFLRNWHAKGDESFDCYAFACLVGGVPRERERIWTHWTVTERQRRESGDVIFLINETPKRFHAAVYLDAGFYLSVWGAGGDLEVATLPDMERDFKTSKVIEVLPRP